jgi:adenylyltransferase/sulfurtransferase
MQESANMMVSVRGPNVVVTASNTLLSVESAVLGDLSISCRAYDEQIRSQGVPHVLLDVRVKRQYEMCSLGGSINIPLADVEKEAPRIAKEYANIPIFCFCRRGIASAEATRILSEYPGIHSVQNITGGIQSWVKEVDPSFPLY